MSKAIVITPVKDSLTTTIQTIEAISCADGDFTYIVFNDFSGKETSEYLEKAKTDFHFQLINLSDITTTPSPNYKLVLQMAQNKALENNCPLIIIESDVVVKSDTILRLIQLNQTLNNVGLLGAITTDRHGNYNFPYSFVKSKRPETIETSHSLSFCCTLISLPFLENFDFKSLSENKDWFDIYISRKSRQSGFENFLSKELEVLHIPHSSRPWKQLKYTNPLLYYIRKYFNKRDRI